MLAIIRKDLAEQSFILAPACLLALVGLVTLVSRGPVHADSLLRAFDAFVVLCAAPLGLLAVRQLVVVEFVRRGFDALEPLPVSLPAALAGKALTGFVLVASVLAAGAAVTTSALRLLTEVPPGATVALAARAASFALAVYGAAFLLACTGRHRHTALLAAVVALGAAQRAGLVELERLAPWRLARGGFYGAGAPFDGPAGDAAVMGLLSLALGVALASSRRGRLARAWSGSWTVADGGRALALGLVAVAVLGADRLGERPPLRLEGAAARRGEVSVRLPAPEHAARAEAVAALAAAALDDWAARAGAAALPVVIDLAPGLPPDASQRLDAGGARGLLLRTAFTDPAWDPAAFQAYLLGELTADAAPPGSDLALDGFPLWRAQTDGASDGALALRGRIELHAAWTIEALGGLPPLAEWPRVQERVGPAAARALAAWVLARLADLHGAPALDHLLEDALRARPFQRAFGAGPLARLQALAGARAPALDEALARAATALTAARADELGALPRPALVLIEAEPDGALRFSVSPGPGCPTGLPCALLHTPERADGASRPRLSASAGARRDEALVGGPAGQTLWRYSAGADVRCGLAVPAPVVGGELVLAWRRVVVGAPAGAGP